MYARHRAFDQLAGVLAEADEPMTAREILQKLENDDELESTHRVATVLGRRARHGEVEVIPTTPYQYKLNH